MTKPLFSPSARLVCETDLSLVVYAPSDARGRTGVPDPLVVTFPSMTTRLDGLRFWQDTHLHRAGVSGLGLMSKQPHWFPRAEMARLLPSLLPIIARHRPARVVTWGYSMGGTPALMYGRGLGADLSVAHSPYFSIDPKVISRFDARRVRAFDPRLHSGFKIEADDLSPMAVLLYDPLFDLDLQHARRIEALSTRVQRVVTTGCGHFSITPVQASEVGIQSFVRLLIDGSAESFVRNARNLVRAGRDVTPDYHQELSCHLLRHKRPELALRCAERALQLQPLNARRRINLSELQEAIGAAWQGPFPPERPAGFTSELARSIPASDVAAHPRG